MMRSRARSASRTVRDGGSAYLPGHRDRAGRALAGLLVLLSAIAGCGGMAGPSAPPPPPGVVLATIPVGSPPTYLAINPDGSRVFAASNALLSVIDTSGNTVLAKLPINPNPTGMAASPDGAKLYVDNLFSVTLTVLDTATNTMAPGVTMFLQRLRGGFGRMAVSPDGRTIYVANATNRAFGVLDLAGGPGNVLKPTVFPVDVAIAPDGRTVYYAGCKPICTPGFVQLFDTGTQLFTQEIAVDGNPYRIALSPDATRAYVANLSGPSVSVVDLTSRNVIATVRVPPQPTGLAVTRDGSAIYVASQTAGTLSVIDAGTLAVRASLAVPQAREVVVSPDGSRAYVSSGERVLVLDARRLPAT